MFITKEEKDIIIRQFFLDSLRRKWFTISPITDCFIFMFGEDSKEYKEWINSKEYKDLRVFHCRNYSLFPKSTYIKIEEETVSIFKKLGYDFSNLTLPIWH